MNQRQLGKSDLYVSEIGFGCMSLEPGNPSNSQLIRRAFDAGINFFDTADRYDDGLNEETVGQAVKEFRNDIILATKVGHQKAESGDGWEWKPTKNHILSAVEDSLRRLQTDYIDLYQLHGGTLDDPIDDIIEAFDRLKEEGKIRYYGISSIRPNVIREYVKRSNISGVMMQYSLLDRRPEEECLDLLHDAGISVITRGSLAKGVLIDKPPQETLGYSEAEVARMQEAVNKTGNPVGASLQFVLSHPAVATAAAGIRTENQLQEIVDGMQKPVPADRLEKLVGVLEVNRYERHR
ncbi:MAG: aldo/keto reductase [Balneolaceae bacterium]